MFRATHIYLKVRFMTDVELLLISEQIIVVIISSGIIRRSHALVHDVIVLFYRKVLLRLVLPIIVVRSLNIFEPGVLHC